MLSTTNLSIQFEAKPLFEHVSVKFGDGNRYGLIGANGCGKSTLMKILGGELEQSAGDVVLQAGMRMGKLNQNQFAYEDERVLDVVMQGHAEMWAAMRSATRSTPTDATDEDYMRAAELESKVAEYDGYTAEARAGAILIDAGIGEDKHNLPMREIPPGRSCACCWRRRCSRARTCCCWTSRPTTSTSIRSAGSSARSTRTTRR